MQNPSAGTWFFILPPIYEQRGFFEFTKCLLENRISLLILFLPISYTSGQLLTSSQEAACWVTLPIAALKGVQTDIRLALPEPQSPSYLLPVAGVALRLGHEPSPALQCSDLGWFVMSKWRECSCSTVILRFEVAGWEAFGAVKLAVYFAGGYGSMWQSLCGMETSIRLQSTSEPWKNGRGTKRDFVLKQKHLGVLNTSLKM